VVASINLPLAVLHLRLSILSGAARSSGSAMINRTEPDRAQLRKGEA